MTTQTVSTVEVTVIGTSTKIKKYNGFNYAVIEVIYHNKKYNRTYFECNCSSFDTEEGVINFIEEITE